MLQTAQHLESVLGHAVALTHCLCQLHRSHAQAFPHLLQRLDALSTRWPAPADVLLVLLDQE
jgi:hypothetical protein